MKISVAICTRNRAESLNRVLENLTKLEHCQDVVWELIVVDNGSADNTEEIVAKFSGRLPVRYVFEPMAGLSNARNRAVDEAKGSHLIWTDDDVIVDLDWLDSYAAAFRSHPEGAVFGGKILPAISEPAPLWFINAMPLLENMLGYRDFGDLPMQLSASRDIIPYGANYAIRIEEQRRFKYDSNLAACRS